MKNRHFSDAAKWLGVSSSAAALAGWLTLMFLNLSYQEVVSQDTWMTQLEMAGLAVAGMVTAFIRRPLFMILVFILAFFPVGLYLLGVPGFARLIGIVDILFFAASIWMLIEQAGSRRVI